MPHKGKRSRAAKHRELVKLQKGDECNKSHDLDKEDNKSPTVTSGEVTGQNTHGLPPIREHDHSKEKQLLVDLNDNDSYHCQVISGTFHQGDRQFKFPGIQCTYLSLFALIKSEVKDPSNWSSNDVDSCLIDGNASFIEFFAAKNREPHMLLINELPNSIYFEKWTYECHQYDSQILVGVIGHECDALNLLNQVSFPVDEAIRTSFDISNAALFVCAGQTISFWKLTNDYFLFDPHSRGDDGLQCPDGNAVLLKFPQIEDMINFIKTLTFKSRGISVSPFEIVPVSIVKHKCDMTTVLQEASMISYMEDQRKRNVQYKRTHALEESNSKKPFDKKAYMRQYMKDKRGNKNFLDIENELKSKRMRLLRNQTMYKEVEKKREALRKDLKRTHEQFSNAEKERDVKRKCLKRQIKAFRMKEREAEALRKSKLRKEEHFAQAEKERDVKRKCLKRQHKAFRTKEKELDAVRKSKLRKEEHFAQAEKERDVKRKCLIRQHEAFRTKEKESDANNKRLRRQNEAFKMKERQMEALRKSEKRKEEDVKRAEQEQNSRRRAERRNDACFRKKERERDAIFKCLRRQDENYIRDEAERDRKRKRLIRKSETYREAERLVKQSRRSIQRIRYREKKADVTRRGRNRLRSEYRKRERSLRNTRKHGISLLDSIEIFNTSISESCSFICTCCNQLWFKKSCRNISSLENLKSNGTLLEKCLTNTLSVDDTEWICTTCLYNIRKGNIPKLSVINGMRFPQKPPELELCNLEERLVSLRIPFMQIRCLSSGGQYSLKGSVVNVPAQIEETIRALPRPQNETETIPVKLKRMQSMKHAVVAENVRPHVVVRALYKLLETSDLYREANISIDNNWVSDTSEGDEVTPQEINMTADSDAESDTFSEVDERNALPVMTLLDEREVSKDHVVSVAPGEGQKPLSIFKDPNAEYLSFPTLFCGQKRIDNSDRHVKVPYSDICKWELRCVDRRVALHIPNMFFKLKKLQLEQVSGKVHLALRRCKTKGKTYSAGYILNDNMGESLVKLDEGYKIFRTIRNSPQYWENQKKNVFAMIRQLGLPTLFISLSANDLNWSELLISLGKLVDKQDYAEEVTNGTLSWETRSRLVQSDPVTCVRHFQHRVSQFISCVLQNPNSPLGILKDYFYRVEFQQRGSPHIHMLAWISNAPKYTDDSNNENVIQYIDKIASCSSKVSKEEQPYLECQKHKHSRACRRGGKSVCRFGIPFPPMKQTKIIRPYEDENRSQYEESYQRIQKSLNELQEDISFDEFLERNGLTEETYLKAIETSVKTPKIFLKRNPADSRVNPYMKDLMGTWRANHDIQFVLDAYACAMYIVSYISKSAKGMSELMAEACKQARKDNKSLKESVRHIGNKFLNATEVSAQEAAYLILQLNMSEKSRKCEFIQTSPPDERIFLLKSKKALSDLPEDSTDIEADNMVKRYARRPAALEQYCLADYVAKVVSVSKVQSSSSQAMDNYELGSDNENEMAPNDSVDDTKMRYSVVCNGYKIALRTNPKVIRFVRYSEKTDPNNYYREQLMLFHPWRKENSDLLNGYETFKEHYDEVLKTIQEKRLEYEPNAKLLNEIEENVGNDLTDYGDVNPNIESVEANDALKEPEISESFKFYFPQDPEHAQHDIGIDIGLKSHIPNDGLELVQGRLSRIDYFALLAKLNAKQRTVFTHIMHCLSTTPQKQICLFITGGAGVGKSIVIRVLYQALHRFFCSEVGQSPDDIRIAVCAYTGLAAYNVQGSTLHSTFCIEPNKKLTYKQLSDDKRNTLRTKFRNLSVLIVDEVSMVGNGMLNILYHRLQEIKSNYHLPFGGVHIILVGDLFQLRPVGDSWIFADLREGYGCLATNLWKTYFSMYELTEIMRQKEDCTFAELLNRLREGNQDEDDMAMLKSRSISTKAEEYTALKSVPHLFPCNEDVDNHNNTVFDAAGTDKAEIRCIDSVLGDDAEDVKNKIANSVKKCKTNETGNLMNVLKIAVDLNYDTTHNISVDDGICNGTPCILKKIQFINSTQPFCLWVSFLENKIGRETRRKYLHYYTADIDKGWTPIWAVKRTFMYRNKAIIRQQFPLKPSSAKTIHKAQGLTKEEIVVDTSRGSRSHHHYVAYSRVTSLKGLHLLNGLSGTITVDKQVVEEMNRLRKEASLKLSFKPSHDYDSNLLIVFQNAQSLHSHIDLVRNDDTFKDADVIGFVETRLVSDDDNDVFAIEGFTTIIRNDETQISKERRPSHGIAVYCKPDQDVLRTDKLSTPLFESTLVTLHNKRSNQFYTVIFAYKSPRCKFQEFIRYIEDLAKHQVEGNIVLVGDFNFDVSNEQSLNFIKTIKTNFPTLSLLRTGPTTEEKTTLDVSFTSCEKATAEVLTCVWSYHDSLIVSL